jgi:hypothetical protein
MDIGGYDITVPTKFDPKQTIVEAIKAIESVWGTSVIEVDVSAETFVYRSKEAAEAWDAEGWTEQYGSSMINLLPIGNTPGEFTFIIDNNEDNILLNIVDAITDALKP